MAPREEGRHSGAYPPPGRHQAAPLGYGLRAGSGRVCAARKRYHRLAAAACLAVLQRAALTMATSRAVARAFPAQERRCLTPPSQHDRREAQPSGGVMLSAAKNPSLLFPMHDCDKDTLSLDATPRTVLE